MAGAIISTVQALLKDVYLPPIVEQLNNDVFLLSRIEKVTDFELVGNQVVVPLHKGRTGAIGSRLELEALPPSGNQVFARATFDLAYHYGRIQVSGVAQAKTKSQAGSFADVLKLEMDGLRTDLRKDQARQVWGNSDGNAGGPAKIAQCGASGPSTTVTLGSAEPLRKGHLYVGMVVDVGTAASPRSLVDAVTTPANGLISAVNIATPSITIGASITVTSANFVSRSGNAVSATVGKELTGLQQLVSTGNSIVGGIDDSTAGNEYWKNIRDSSGGALALDKMLQVWNQSMLADGKTPSVILTTYGLQRAYFNLLQPLVRYVEPMTIKSGYNALDFQNKPLVADLDGKFGNIYFLQEDAFKNFTNEDWHWLADDGNILKWVIGFDAWEAAIAKYNQLGITRRNGQAVMSGLTDANGF